MTITEEDRIRMGTIAPELAEALRQNPFPDLTHGDPNASVLEVRYNRGAHLQKLRYLYPIPGPIPDEVTEIDHQVQVRDGQFIRVRIYTPVKAATSSRPLIVMMHEGGWVAGDLTDEDLNCRLFARDLGAVCVNVEYRLAPEFLWPTQVNDCYDVVRWCAKTVSPSSPLLAADPKAGFIVGGASAGGNLAAIMCQIARDENLSPALTGQYLCVPALLWANAVPEKWQAEYRSRREPSKDPIIKKTDTGGTEATLKPDIRSPLFSPLLHANLRGLPPAFFQLGGLDPLRDEGLLYERVLREENQVPTKLNVYDGYGHMFWTNWPLMKRSGEFVDDTREGIKWLLTVGSKTT